MKIGRQAYAESGIDPRDIDVAEIHDAFTISQVIHLEDLSLVPRGEAWRHALGGAGPRVNTDGGLLARGHPPGATGLAQLHAIRRALTRGPGRLGLIQEAGGLQVLGQVLSSCQIYKCA